MIRPPAITLLFALSIVPVSNGQDESPRGRLLFLGVAYDEAPGRGLTVDNFNYASDNFTNLFTAQSVKFFRSIEIETVKGNAVTRSTLGARLRALKGVAKKDDLVFLYWGTHGATNAQGWGANLAGNETVLGSEIKAELAQVPCPVIVAISTCGSGGFVRQTPTTNELPANVAAFCACGRRESTTNELDVSLLEALAGFGDRDRNGQVTLQEVVEYVPR